MLKRIGTLFWIGLAALVMRACVFEPVRLADDAMLPLLGEGEVALISKLRYGLRVPGAGAVLVEWDAPRKGDLVAAVAVGDPPLNLLRRVGAVPGEKATLGDGSVVELKPGEFFLVADQPTAAIDSRKFGPVPRKAIIGKATHVLFGKRVSGEAGSGVESSRTLEPLP